LLVLEVIPTDLLSLDVACSCLLHKPPCVHPRKSLACQPPKPLGKSTLASQHGKSRRHVNLASQHGMSTWQVNMACQPGKSAGESNLEASRKLPRCLVLEHFFLHSFPESRAGWGHCRATICSQLPLALQLSSAPGAQPSWSSPLPVLPACGGG
jgi:hypothetical protein